MDRQDQQAIESLFHRLGEVERQSGPRDAEAEAFIRSEVTAQPAAPYYMAQTIIVQQRALEEAQRRIEELESRGGGGLFSGLFGDGNDRQRQAAAPPPQANAAGQGPWAGRSNGFLAGAAQTAVGVAGGLMLGNLIGGALFGSPANAAEAAPPEAAPADQGMDQPEMDGGGDFGDFDLGF